MATRTLTRTPQDPFTGRSTGPTKRIVLTIPDVDPVEPAPEVAQVDVPDGMNVDDTLSWAEPSEERAKAALTAELAREKPRKGVVEGLTAALDHEPEPNPEPEPEPVVTVDVTVDDGEAITPTDGDAGYDADDRGTEDADHGDHGGTTSSTTDEVPR